MKTLMDAVLLVGAPMATLYATRDLSGLIEWWLRRYR